MLVRTGFCNKQQYSPVLCLVLDGVSREKKNTTGVTCDARGLGRSFSRKVRPRRCSSPALLSRTQGKASSPPHGMSASRRRLLRPLLGLAPRDPGPGRGLYTQAHQSPQNAQLSPRFVRQEGFPCVPSRHTQLLLPWRPLRFTGSSLWKKKGLTGSSKLRKNCNKRM